MAESDLDRSARLLAQHLRAALPHAWTLFQADTEAGLDARAAMREAVNALDDAAPANAIFYVSAIQSERIRTTTIEKSGPRSLTRTDPFA